MTGSNFYPSGSHEGAQRAAEDLASQLITVEVLREVIRDVAALHDAGVWPWAYERCLAALDEHRNRVRQRSSGLAAWIDLLAADVAKLAGIDRELAISVARKSLLETPLAAISRELRACRLELTSPQRRASR